MQMLLPALHAVSKHTAIVVRQLVFKLRRSIGQTQHAKLTQPCLCLLEVASHSSTARQQHVM